MNLLSRLLLTFTLISAIPLSHAAELQKEKVGHKLIQGTFYGEKMAHAYKVSRHGPDGKFWVDPYVHAFLTDTEGEKVLDAGCGAAPWSIYAAQHGASVWGIDIQSVMLDQAAKAIKESGLTQRIHLTKGDVAHLPYESNTFDKAISILVGCNLPNAHITTTENGETYESGLSAHIQEIERTLRPGGRAMVCLPSGFGVVFTSDVDDASTQSKIQAALNMLQLSQDPERITEVLSGLKDIHRATFAMRDNQLKLIENESELLEGEAIWRKIPGLVVPNYYHSEKSYENAFHAAGLKIEAVHKYSFKNEAERIDHNKNVAKSDALGKGYIGNHSFVIYEVIKS